MAGIQADHWRWMTFTWENLILKAQQQSLQQLFVGICRYWENSLADSRLDFTEKSPQRTEVALEFVQSSISAIWSQPSDSDYEHTPNGCFFFMGLCFRAAFCFIQRIKQPCLQYFSSENEKWHESFSLEKKILHFLHLRKTSCHSHWYYFFYSTDKEMFFMHLVCQIFMFVKITRLPKLNAVRENKIRYTLLSRREICLGSKPLHHTTHLPVTSQHTTYMHRTLITHTHTRE